MTKRSDTSESKLALRKQTALMNRVKKHAWECGQAMRELNEGKSDADGSIRFDEAGFSVTVNFYKKDDDEESKIIIPGEMPSAC